MDSSSSATEGDVRVGYLPVGDRLRHDEMPSSSIAFARPMAMFTRAFHYSSEPSRNSMRPGPSHALCIPKCRPSYLQAWHACIHALHGRAAPPGSKKPRLMMSMQVLL